MSRRVEVGPAGADVAVGGDQLLQVADQLGQLPTRLLDVAGALGGALVLAAVVMLVVLLLPGRRKSRSGFHGFLRWKKGLRGRRLVGRRCRINR